MKHFLIKISIFALILLLADQIFGAFYPSLYHNTADTDSQKHHYIRDKSNEDILIFGSSRASHHYNSQMLEDSIKLSCYNCGSDGEGVFLAYERLLLNTQRGHLPKIIIYDIEKAFDLYEGFNFNVFEFIKQDFEKEGVREIFEDIDSTESYKMTSNMYRYNSSVLGFVKRLSLPSTQNEKELIKGFDPLHGALDPLQIKTPSEEPLEIDSLKIKYIEKFISLASKTKLIFVYSPIWYGMNIQQIQPIIDICDKHNLPFINFSNDPKYVHNDEYFKDGAHLNATGADEFTRDLIKRLKDENLI